MDSIKDLFGRSTNHTHQNPVFDFGFLWSQAILFNTTRNSTLRDYVYHPSDSQSRLGLTFDGCTALVGNDDTHYSRQDVYDRVFLWRWPLVALIATATLPALGMMPKLFTFLHIVADPIDALWSLFYRLDIAALNSRWARDIDSGRGGDSFLTSGTAKYTQTEDASSSSSGSRHAESLRLVLANMPSRGQEDSSDVKHQLEADTVRNYENHDFHEDMIKYDLDVAASIVDTYAEWDLGRWAKDVIMENFNVDELQQRYPSNGSRTSARTKSIELAVAFRERCARAAAHISADHRSRGFPSLVTTVQFYFTLFAGLWKTYINLGHSYDPANEASVSINRTPHNIAFGAMYFWVPLAVLTTAFVGGAQTKNSVPRILERLRADVAALHRDIWPNETSNVQNARHQSFSGASYQTSPDGQNLDNIPRPLNFPKVSYDVSPRWIHGGIPTWQPSKFREIFGKNCWRVVLTFLCACVIVSAPFGAAVYISYRTPTEGLGCRFAAQFAFLISWLASFFIDGLLSIWAHESVDLDSNTLGVEDRRNARHSRLWVFWMTFMKDLLLCAGVVASFTLESIGIFNSCNCWTEWWSRGEPRYISFPQDQYVFDTLKRRMKIEFPATVASLLGFELLVFAILAAVLWDGHRVLKQRDLDAVLRPLEWYQKPIHNIEGYFRRRHKDREIARAHKRRRSSQNTQPTLESGRQYEDTGPVARVLGSVLRRRTSHHARLDKIKEHEDSGSELQVLSPVQEQEPMEYYGGPPREQKNMRSNSTSFQ